MKSKDKVLLYLFCALTIFAILGASYQIHAETKQVPIISLEQQKDLVVLFSFDKEAVDITFLSPSGIRLTSADAGVEMAEGELWRTYRILGAEIGTWSVEYDLRGNSSIEYSVIEEEYGLWIQYITPAKSDSNHLTVNFEADNENRILDYRYEIYAVQMSNGDFSQKLASGWAVSNEDKEEEISLSSLSSGTYQLRLEVSCVDGDAELFDAMLSESFEFSNPNEPEHIEDYCVYIDVGNLECEVVWDDYAQNCDSYRLLVYGDEEDAFYDGILDGDVTSSGISFPQDTEKLTVSLPVNRDGIWSVPLTKQIDLAGGEYLRLGAKETTGDDQIVLEYSVSKDRELFLSVNEKESQFCLTETGYLGITLEQGSNTVHAEFESDHLVFYMVNTELYFDAYPPKIILYEALDGKTFSNDMVEIIGKITGGTHLTANGEIVEIDAIGEFSYSFPLASGENVLTLEAADVNGNAAVQVLTLYRSAANAGIIQNRDVWVQIRPLIATLSLSVMIIIAAAVFLKKKEKPTGDVKKKSMVRWILLDFLLVFAEILCVYEFIAHHIFANSMGFLEMSEHSVLDAAEYLKVKNMFGMISAAGFAICILFILLTIFMGKRRKRISKQYKSSG